MSRLDAKKMYVGKPWHHKKGDETMPQDQQYIDTKMLLVLCGVSPPSYNMQSRFVAM